MSILGTLSRRQSSVPSKSINACSRVASDLSSLVAREDDGKLPRRTARRPGFDATHTRRKHAPALEDVFVRSLVAAGRCWEHKADDQTNWQRGARGWRQIKNQGMIANDGRRFLSTNSRNSRAAMVATRDEVEPLPTPRITKEEYKDMVNTYGLPSDIWDQPAFGMGTQNKKRKQHSPLAPRLVVTAEQESRPPYAEREVLEPVDEVHEHNLGKLSRVLTRAHGTVSHNYLWRAYCKLQAPRLRYMSDYMIRTLFGHLAWSEQPYHDSRARQRYLTLLEECVGEQIPLTATEWSSAMYYAGHAARKGSDNEVKDAIELWLKMEESGVKADHVTFNILFDVAIKAERFALADTIYNELTSRGMELDRYFRISMINYAGARGDGDGVRKAFNEMVNAGEIIDTAVMNCIIFAFIRAGEASAADHVFHKMKALHESKYGTRGPDDWRGQRKLAKLLNKTGRQLRAERQSHETSFFGAPFSGDARREQIQKASPISPNSRTFRLLLRYHSRVAGDLDRVKELLAENEERGFHVHGSVYLNIFSSFIIHGGYVHSVWKPSELESYWTQFLEASSAPNAGYWLSTRSESIQTLHFDLAPEDDVELFPRPESLTGTEREDLRLNSVSEEDKAPYFTLGLVVTVIRAFYKCKGLKRTSEVWTEIKGRWKECGREESQKIEALIEDLQRKDL